MNKTVKHAPGPWKVEKHNLSFGRYTIKSDFMPLFEDIWPKHPKTGNPIFVAMTQSTDNEGDSKRLDEINEANAHLIASSPELLESLKELVYEMTLKYDNNQLIKNVKYQKALRVIEKAEGK